MLQLLHDTLDKTANRNPNKIAVMTRSDSITYCKLVQESKKLAGYLYKNGVRRGDRVAIVLPSGIQAVTAVYAASRLGAISILQGEQVKLYQLQHILKDSEPSTIITSNSLIEPDQLRSFARVFTVETEWSLAMSDVIEFESTGLTTVDPALLIYTSGSTSKPKAVISTHRNIAFATWAIQERLEYRQSDNVANFLPLSFDYGLYQIFLTFWAGATVILERGPHISVSLLVDLAQWRVSVLPIMPNLARILIALLRRSQVDLPHLRMITNTGAHLPRSYIAEISCLLPQSSTYVMFGLTECKRVTILTPEEYLEHPHSVGRPLIDTECFILDEEGGLCDPGEVGELVVRGPHVMSGYWRSPELTDTRFRAWGTGIDRALFTGDLCSMDEGGFLYFHGRGDDIYKQNGFRVSTLEVEAAAFDIPFVTEAAVVVSSSKSGATLYVVSGRPAHDVLQELRSRLEDFKLPESVVVVDKMPLTSNGKVDRGLLHKEADERHR